MSESTNPDDVVTLVRLGELTAAQLLRGRLDSEGIACFLPDEIMATQTWHLQSAIGGVRVQVRQADLERAKEILAEPGVADLVAQADAGQDAAAREPAKPAGDGEPDDGTISVGDRAAFRALRVALVSLWLMGLVHPYSLWLSIQALGRDDLTAWGRSRAGIGLMVSLVGCAWMAFLVYRLVHITR